MKSYSYIWAVLVLFAYVFQVVLVGLSTYVYGGFTSRHEDVLFESPLLQTFISVDPATYTAWPLIFLFQLVFSIYQILPPYHKMIEGINYTRVASIGLFLLNGFWPMIFASGLYFVAIFVSAMMLQCLLIIYRSLEINYTYIHTHFRYTSLLPQWCFRQMYPFHYVIPAWHTKLCVFVPFSLTFAWQIFATVQNFYACMGQIGWNQEIFFKNATQSISMIRFGGDPDSALLMLLLYFSICIVMIFRYNDIPFALMGLWVLFGVIRRNRIVLQSEQYITLRNSSLLFFLLLVIAIIIGSIKTIFDNIRARKRLITSTPSDRRKNISPRVN